MRTRLKGFGRRYWAGTKPLFFLLSWPLRLLWRPFRPVLLPMWRFWGRVGLAIRNIWVLLIWEPLLFLVSPLANFLRWLYRALLRPSWNLLGRMGVAFRLLLTRFFWRPMMRPFRALWRRSETRRRLWGRRYGSKRSVFQARLRVMVKRPSPPPKAIHIPKSPDQSYRQARQIRWMTAVITVLIVLAFSLFQFQERQPDDAVAERLPRVIIATPSPQPPTLTPTPTVAVKLTPWATPDPLAEGGTLAFTQRINGNSDIYLLPIGQAEPVRLTADLADDRAPAWSPDGQEIAFTSRRDGNWDIYVYNFSQGELRRITRETGFDGHPSWSPDGQWLVYESYQNDNLDIFIVKADLSDGPYRLTEDPALDADPAWSPGGRQIAFTSWRTGHPELFQMSLDAVEDALAVNLTNSPDLQESDPTFSADGRWLAYVEDSAGFPMILALPLTAEGTIAGPPMSVGQQGRHPAFAPDGRSLLYVFQKSGQGYLMGGSPEGWGVAPQVLAGQGRIADVSWTAVNVSPDLFQDWRPIDRVRDEPLFIEAAEPPAADEPPVTLFEIAVSAPAPFLSDQVDQSFDSLRQRVIAETGWDFLGRLDNLFEPLAQKPLPGQSAESWNKAGRAFDFYYRDALGFDPQVEVLRETDGVDVYWRVFVRTAVQDGSLGEPLRQLPWDFSARFGNDPQFYDDGGKLKEEIPAGYYVDFTALAADFGWERVPADSNWRSYFPAIRFWHFENRQGLSWDAAMRQLYSDAELADQ